MRNLIQPRKASSNEHLHIELLAYRYWEQRGRPEGSPDVDWFRAVETLRAEPADDVLFPAYPFGPSE